MVSCDELWDLLSAYADGMTTPDEAARVERHVAICHGCASDLRFMQQTAHVLAAAPEVVPPASLRDSILAATIYRPTWQDKIRAAARRLVPASPLRAMAFAGSAAALLLVAYVAATRAPQVRENSRTDVASVKQPAPRPSLTPDPLASRPSSTLARNEIPKSSPVTATARPSREPSSQSAPVESGPRIVQASSRMREDQALRARAEQALLARADSAIRGFGRRAASRVTVASGRPHVNELIPSLQPERVEQPRENLPEMTIDTADMTMPMTAGNSNPATSPRDSVAGPVSGPNPNPVVERPRITLAGVTTSSASVPSSMVTLADLRRQLRRNNMEASEAMHPELHLRARRETLDVVKSSF